MITNGALDPLDPDFDPDIEDIDPEELKSEREARAIDQYEDREYARGMGWL